MERFHTHTHTYSQNFSTHGAVLTYFQTGRITGARHTRTGGGSCPVGPRGLLSVRRRRVPRAESGLRAVSAPASWPEPAVVPGAALGAASREDGRPNEPELLLNSRCGGASGWPVALGFSLRAGRPSSRPPYTTPESATGPEAIPAVVPPELLAKQQVEQAQQVAASWCPAVPSSRTSWSSVPMLHGLVRASPSMYWKK